MRKRLTTGRGWKHHGDGRGVPRPGRRRGSSVRDATLRLVIRQVSRLRGYSATGASASVTAAKTPAWSAGRRSPETTP